MEKIETVILVVKLSKLWLSRSARKRNSRLGLSHRKKGSSTTPLCVCVNSYCITLHRVVWPSATLITTQVLLLPVTERRDKGWCLVGERWPFSLASQWESHCVCQMDQHFSLPSAHNKPILGREHEESRTQKAEERTGGSTSHNDAAHQWMGLQKGKLLV